MRVALCKTCNEVSVGHLSERAGGHLGYFQHEHFCTVPIDVVMMGLKPLMEQHRAGAYAVPPGIADFQIATG